MIDLHPSEFPESAPVVTIILLLVSVMCHVAALISFSDFYKEYVLMGLATLGYIATIARAIGYLPLKQKPNRNEKNNKK